MHQVQSGGSFDVDYSVVGPGEKVIMEGTKERQGDFVFTAQSVGEYRFCFNNEMSTFAEKLVDFEIAVRFYPFPFFPPRSSLVYKICVIGQRPVAINSHLWPTVICEQIVTGLDDGPASVRKN